MKTGEHLAAPNRHDRLHMAKRHFELALRWKKEILAIVETRRHYGNYFKGIPHFKEFRMRLVTAETVEELMQVFADIEGHFLQEEVLA